MKATVSFVRPMLAMALSAGLLCEGNAQDSLSAHSQHSLYVATGFSDHRLRDDVISPLAYGGSQIPVVVVYECAREASRQSLGASFDRLELTSRITDRAGGGHVAMNINGFVRYSYARRVWKAENLDAGCFLGGSVQGCLNWRTFHYTRDRSEPSFEGMVSIGLDAILEAKPFTTGKDQLSLHLSVPLLSYVLLNDRYNAMVSETLSQLDLERNLLGQVMTRGSLATLDKLFECQAEVSYRTFLSNGIAVQCQYLFVYYNFAQYKHLWHARSLTNQVVLGLVFDF